MTNILKRVFRFLAAAIVATFAIGSLSSCAVAPMDMSAYSAVIDVRTADEWATGHLDGAVNIDIQGPDFASKIDALDHSANYVVYCRSGNRAGQAIKIMEAAGFTGDLMNAGSVADASAMTGMKVVQ